VTAKVLWSSVIRELLWDGALRLRRLVAYILVATSLYQVKHREKSFMLL
jgi:hypothetical protein